jgi:hypothetical protein
MHAPQIIYIVLIGLNIVFVGYKHGQEKTGHYNLGGVTVSLLVVVGLMFWGGFFSHGMDVPQIVMCVLFGIGYILAIAMDGKPEKGKYNILYTVVTEGIKLILLHAGNFFS